MAGIKGRRNKTCNDSVICSAVRCELWLLSGFLELLLFMYCKAYTPLLILLLPLDFPGLFIWEYIFSRSKACNYINTITPVLLVLLGTQKLIQRRYFSQGKRRRCFHPHLAFREPCLCRDICWRAEQNPE